MDRRHLTDAQKVILGQKIEPNIANIAKAKQAHGMTAPGRPLPKPERSSTHVNERSTVKAWQTKTQEQVAAQVGIGSGQTDRRHKKIINQAAKEALGDPSGARLRAEPPARTVE